MTTLLRYTGLAALLLVTLVVVMVCGEGLCESCAHACLSRVDRADRLRRTVARLFACVTSTARTVAGQIQVVAAARPAPWRAWQPPMLEAVAPLRI